MGVNGMTTNYTTRESYSRLCGVMDDTGGTVRLSRNGTGWGLIATLPPKQDECQQRAAGFFFNEIDELDGHAEHILLWLDEWASGTGPATRRPGG